MAAAAALGLCACSPAIATSSETSSSPTSTPSSQSSSSSTPTVTEDEISSITKEGTYTIKGVVVAVSTNSILIDDGTGRIVYFNQGNCGDYAIGDYLKVSGAITNSANYRYGNYQFTSTATISKLDSSKAPAVDKTVAAYDGAQLTTWFNSMKADSSKGYTEGTSSIKGLAYENRPLVSMKVKIVVNTSGSNVYINFSTDGFSGSGSFTIPSSITAITKDAANKEFDVTGYLYEVVSQKYPYLWLTSATEHVNPVTVTSDSDTVDIGATIQLNAVSTTSGATFSYSSSDTNVATVSDSGLVTGVAVGKTTITVTANTGDSATIDIYVADETVKETTVADLVAGTSVDSNTLYTVSGIVEASKGDVYGNAYLTDPSSGKSIKVFGNTTTVTALSWSKGKPHFANPKDAKTSLFDVKDGDAVTLDAVYSSEHKNISAVTTSHVASTNTYAATLDATENGTASLDKTSSLAYGDTVTVTCAPSEGYKVSTVKVTAAFGSVETTVDANNANVYTFKATCVNKVSVSFESSASTTLYSTGFESSEGFAAKTTYNNSTEAIFGNSESQWGTLSGTVSTTAPIDGTQSMQMRDYNSMTVVPCAYMLFDVTGAMSISLDYLTTGGYSGKLYYSLDSGANWVEAGEIAAASASTSFKYNFESVQTSVRFKIEEIASSTLTDKAQLIFDNVVIKSAVQ